MKKTASSFSAQLLILAFSCVSSAQKVPDPNAGRTPILLELFTSEGCSSCPPADLFVEKLDASQPIPKAELIVLSEHVDYFNHGGWVDPFSSQSVTARQYAYVHALGLKDAYTPQIIVDGHEVLQLDDSQQIRKVFDGAAAAPTIPIRLGSISADHKDKNELRIKVDIDRNPGRRDAGVYVAIARDHAASNVRAGENDGRSLTHVAVLRSLTRVGELKPGEPFSRDISLKIKPNSPPRKIRAIVFVQESGPGKVLGAAVTTTTQ